MKKLISLALILVLSLSFTAFAVDFTCLLTTVSDGATDVYVKEGSIVLTFSDDVDSATLSTITMVKGDDAFTDFTSAIGNSNEVVITFGADLAYSTQYAIEFSGLESTSAVALTGTLNKLTFTTEAEPSVKIDDVILTKGVGGTSVADQGDEILDADSSIQGFKVSLANSAADAKTVNIVCALYNSNGIIKRVLTSEKSIDATATETIELGTFIDSGYAGGFAKIYIWNNLSDKSPFVGSRIFNIQ